MVGVDGTGGGRRPGQMPAGVDGTSWQRAVALLRSAEAVAVLTGAGISTDSGIADFRGPQGVWTKNPEAEKASNIDTYLADGEVRRRAWQSRLSSPIWAARPNRGHDALVALERSGRLHTLVTQNIDGLHLLAGHDPEAVIEVHGNARSVVCWTCGDRNPMGHALERVRAGDPDPRCEGCGGILKSTTVLFGENLPDGAKERAALAATQADLLLTVGTSLAVYPVAGMVHYAHRAGVPVMIVNGQLTELDHLADAVLLGSIGDVLPSLVSAAIDPDPE